MAQNTKLTFLDCANNHFPLAMLNTISKRTDIISKNVGIQTLVAENILLNVAVAVDTVFNGNNTNFTVIKYDQTPAIKNTDYTVSNGKITFLTSNIYRVETGNSAIASSDTAKVVNFYMADKNLQVPKKSVPFTENFETSATNWTIANGNQPNQWIIGNNTAQAGTKSIYISNDTATSAYTITQNSVVHFYCDVEFTASTAGYQLSFDHKGMGERSWDCLKVFITDTSNLPYPGYELAATYLGTYVDDNTWQHTSLNIPASYSGTVKRLVFSWQNDNNSGIQPPTAIDNISLKISDDIGITSNKQVIEKTFIVYPNPVVNGKLNISPLAPKGGTELVQLYNVNGMLVGIYSLPLGEVGGIIDIANLPKGNYLLKIGNEIVKIVNN